MKTSGAVTTVTCYQRAFPLPGRAARLPLSAQGCSLPAAHLTSNYHKKSGSGHSHIYGVTAIHIPPDTLGILGDTASPRMGSLMF